MAMAGKDCVALAVDKRFGSGPALVNIQPRSVFVASPHLMVAFTGLEGDVQSLQEELSALVALKYTRGLGFRHSQHSNQVISPRALASLTSHVLYNRKRAPYYVEPLVVGLERLFGGRGDLDNDENGNNDNDLSNTSDDDEFVRYRPFLCGMDIIGATSVSPSFVCGGAATQSLYGTAEALWKPRMEADELVQVCGQAFLSALERDCLSGYGALIYLITGSGIVEYDLTSRDD